MESALAHYVLEQGGIPSWNDAIQIIHDYSPEEIYEAAHIVTRTSLGDAFDTCSIVNVKSGNCTEDCQWCAQSRHYNTGVETHGLLDKNICFEWARCNLLGGVGRFSLVAEGRSQSLKEMQVIGAIYQTIKESLSIKLCASLGLLSREKLQILYHSGVTTYHCNMETAPSFFPKLCTTHTQDEKLQTICWAREIGMQICSGGIIGMGETVEQRIEFAFYLRDVVESRSIPINILQPIPGTPLENTPPLTEDEYLLTIALFRLINPKAFLRFSGGRKQLSLETMKKAMYIGINSAITGDLLTTIGLGVQDDMRMIEEMNYTNSNKLDWDSYRMV